MASRQFTTLVLSPHVDDEVLGCFSFLDAGTFVVYAGVESRPTIPRSERLDELDASSQALGFAYEVLDFDVNRYDTAELIGPFEQLIERVRPHTVLMPVRSYNQDHRAVHDAARVATRPHDTLWRVDRVLVFEQPHSVIWPYEQSAGLAGGFGYHRIIDIRHKLDAYARYASQVRGHRSPETVAALASLRGAEIGEPHAEAFQVLRWISHGADTP